MDKKLIALLLASLLAVPYAASADVSVYGRIRMGLANVDVTGTDDYWELQNSTSRLGVDAKTTTSAGTEVFMKYEFSVDGVAAAGITGARHSYIGFKSGFGTFTFGQQYVTLYDLILSPLDNQNMFFSTALNYESSTGANFSSVAGGDFTGFGRVGKSLEWTMVSGPLTWGAAAIVDGASGANGESFIDATQFGVKWDGGVLKLAGALVADDTDKGTGTTRDATALYGEFAFGMAKLMAGLYDIEIDNSGVKTDRTDTDIQLNLKFSDTLLGWVGISEVENIRDGFHAALVNELGGGVKTFVEFSSLDYEPGMGTNDDRMAVGVRYDFK